MTDMPSGGPVPAADYRQELEQADAIIAARVISVAKANDSPTVVSADASSEYDQLMAARVKPLRTLVGSVPEDEITVYFLQGKYPSRPWRTLSDGDTVLLFLKKTGQGYIPTSATGSFFQTMPEINDSPPAGLSPNAAVMQELQAIIKDQNSPEEIRNEALAASSSIA